MARTSSLRLLACVLPAALLPACSVDAPPPQMISQAPRSARIEDLSGHYCYFGFEYNVRTFGMGVDGIPFVPARELREPTEVIVRASPTAVVFHFTGADGAPRAHTYDIAANGARWHDGELLQKHSSGLKVNGFIFFGDTDYTVATREARLFRRPDGNLVLSWSVRDKGYTTGGDHGGFHVERSVALLLPPKTSTCEVDTGTLRMQPWYEPGPDLRDPTCTTVLEEQVAAMLVDYEETPEDADDAAAESVRSFRDGTEAAHFMVESRSGTKYHFAVSRGATSCKLRLTGRDRKTKYGRMTTSSLKSRPLPGCVCNN
jgi:hypothetical protein